MDTDTRRPTAGYHPRGIYPRLPEATFYPTKMTSFAILIDGGFAKRKIGCAAKPATATDFQEFVEKVCRHPALDAMRLHRVYFYDAAPLTDVVNKPLQGGKIDFGKEPTATRNRQLMEGLYRLPFFAVRTGELAFRGWSVTRAKLRESGTSVEISATDLHPEIQQKGVDMRIGLDIAALTLKKQVQVIVLVTGDSDFIPAMKFARKEGAQLFLVPMGHGIKDGMHEHADLIIDLD